MEWHTAPSIPQCVYVCVCVLVTVIKTSAPVYTSWIEDTETVTLWDATWPPAHLSRTDLPHRKQVHFLFPPCVHSMWRFLLPVSLNCRPQMSHGKGPATTQNEYVRKCTFLFPSTGETRTGKCRHLSGTFPGASVGQSGTWSSRRRRRIWTAGAESARSCAPPGEGGVWTTCGRSTTWKRSIVIFIIMASQWGERSLFRKTHVTLPAFTLPLPRTQKLLHVVGMEPRRRLERERERENTHTQNLKNIHT